MRYSRNVSMGIQHPTADFKSASRSLVHFCHTPRSRSKHCDDIPRYPMQRERVAEVTKRWTLHKLAQDGLHGRDTIITYHGVYARVGRKSLSLPSAKKSSSSRLIQDATLCSISRSANSVPSIGTKPE